MADEKRPLTSRNLVDFDIGPLRRLTGILDSMPTEVQAFGEGDSKRNVTRVVLNLKEIEVIEATEPYHFPIYSTRPMSVSNRKKSMWGFLSESFNSLVDSAMYTPEQLEPRLEDGSDNPNFVKPSDRMDITECIGKRIGLVLADGEDGRPVPPDLFDQRANEGKGGDVPTPSWAIYSVEGIGTVGVQSIPPLELAMQLLNNKSAADFNGAVIAEEAIRGDSDLMSSIGKPLSDPTSFVTTMVSSGKFTKDDNEVYHRVEVEEA